MEYNILRDYKQLVATEYRYSSVLASIFKRSVCPLPYINVSFHRTIARAGFCKGIRKLQGDGYNYNSKF